MLTTNIEMYIVSRIVEGFTENLKKELKELRKTLIDIGMNVNNSIPEPFNSEFIKIQAYYSMDRNQHFIVFNKTKIKDEFNFMIVKGNPLPITIFDFQSEVEESLISGITLQSGNQKLPIDFSVIFSHSGFVNRLNNTKEFAIEMVKSAIDFHKYQKTEEKKQHVRYLEQIKSKMGELFFDDTVPELTIDKFLEENPLILNQGLNLVKPQHQIILKNILGKYEHDLKPDLIAFDLMEKNWVIVDYKKAKRNIIKNHNKVRTGFKAEVNDLRNQILDYLEYFEEKEHREFVLNKFKLDVHYPNGIGIIGNVNIDEQIAFNRLIHNEPKWYRVIPYNYLYDNFCRYVDQYKKQLK